MIQLSFSLIFNSDGTMFSNVYLIGNGCENINLLIKERLLG